MSDAETGAAIVAALTEGNVEPTEPEHVARAAIEAAERNPNAHLLEALAQHNAKHDRNRAVIEAMHTTPPEES